jgi:flagellar basal body-associated protein FliL
MIEPARIVKLQLQDTVPPAPQGKSESALWLIPIILMGLALVVVMFYGIPYFKG